MQVKASREEMKNRALKLMKNISLGDNFIKQLKNKDYVNISEQYLKSEDSIEVTFGCYQRRTYFDTERNMYDIYPYVSGLPELYEERDKFEKEYGHFVYHMHYTKTYFGTLLTLLYLPNYDYRYSDDEVIEDNNGKEIIPTFVNCWNDIEHNALRNGFLPCYVINLDCAEYSEFGDVFFCTTDNGCFMRLA